MTDLPTREEFAEKLKLIRQGEIPLHGLLADIRAAYSQALTRIEELEHWRNPYLGGSTFGKPETGPGPHDAEGTSCIPGCVECFSRPLIARATAAEQEVVRLRRAIKAWANAEPRYDGEAAVLAAIAAEGDGDSHD